MYISFLKKKSATWQLVAVFKGQKRRKTAKNGVKLPKVKEKIALQTSVIFCWPLLLNFFHVWCIYIVYVEFISDNNARKGNCQYFQHTSCPQIIARTAFETFMDQSFKECGSARCIALLQAPNLFKRNASCVNKKTIAEEISKKSRAWIKR